MARINVDLAGGKNVVAFLDTITDSELTKAILDVTDDGYNVIVGSLPSMPILFGSYSRHPGILISLKSGIQSTAAGRYQLLSRYYMYYKTLLKLPDFGPISQDKIAIQQIKESRAYDLIVQGKFVDAVTRCSHIWASFPGADYQDQHMQKIQYLQDCYTNAGGNIV